MLCAALGYSQGVKDVVINEVLVKNANNYQDPYGHRVSWVELCNTGYSKVNLSSCYLILETNGKSYSYRIPKGDERTWLNPGSFAVFFCEGTATKGTFHTNFTLTGDSIDRATAPDYVPDSVDTPLPNQLVTLAFLDANGRDTVDKITYNLADQKRDISVGRIPSTENDHEILFTALESTTPNATNITSPPMPKHEKMRRADPEGVSLTITAVMVVFSALILLYLAFSLVGKLNIWMAKRNKQKTASKGDNKEVVAETADDENMTGEVIAAISMALYQYQEEQHDIESTILTINRVAKAYSPWSSKIYGLTQTPQRK